MGVWSLGREGSLEESTATHPRILAWRIPRTEEPGGLRPMGSHRVGHDRSNLAQHLSSSDCPAVASSTLNPVTTDLSPWPTLTPSSIIQPPPRVQGPQGTETQRPVSSAQSAGAAQLQEGARGGGLPRHGGIFGGSTSPHLGTNAVKSYQVGVKRGIIFAENNASDVCQRLAHNKTVEESRKNAPSQYNKISTNTPV